MSSEPRVRTCHKELKGFDDFGQLGVPCCNNKIDCDDFEMCLDLFIMRLLPDISVHAESHIWPGAVRMENRSDCDLICSLAM